MRLVTKPEGRERVGVTLSRLASRAREDANTATSSPLEVASVGNGSVYKRNARPPSPDLATVVKVTTSPGWYRQQGGESNLKARTQIRNRDALPREGTGHTSAPPTATRARTGVWKKRAVEDELERVERRISHAGVGFAEEARRVPSDIRSATARGVSPLASAHVSMSIPGPESIAADWEVSSVGVAILANAAIATDCPSDVLISARIDRLVGVIST